MLIVETIAKIRRYFFVEGKKIKEISRELRISRNTVRKVIRSGATEHRYVREEQPCPKLGNFKERLDSLLEEDKKRPKRRRLTELIGYLNCCKVKAMMGPITVFSVMSKRGEIRAEGRRMGFTFR